MADAPSMAEPEPAERSLFGAPFAGDAAPTAPVFDHTYASEALDGFKNKMTIQNWMSDDDSCLESDECVTHERKFFGIPFASASAARAAPLFDDIYASEALSGFMYKLTMWDWMADDYACHQSDECVLGDVAEWGGSGRSWVSLE